MSRSAWALLVALAIPATVLAVAPGRPAPTFAVEGKDGEKLRLEQFRGKVVLLNFWATWCKPCQAELPRLQALYERFEGEGFVVFAINVDNARTRGKARDMAERLGLRFPIGFDPDQRVPALYDLSRMPSSFVIDREGVVRYAHAGFEAQDEALFEAAILRELRRSARRGTPPSASE